MKKSLSSCLRLLLVISLLASSLAHTGQAEILDPEANHPLLRRIADSLHRNGIDVIQDWRSNVPTHKRPVVAPLANYQTSLAPKRQQWVREFNRGATGGIAAIKTPERLGQDEFAAKWAQTPQRQRVFISFAREDVAHARRIKAVLEAQGYVAFIYISSPRSKPAQAPAAAGEYLRTAGVHFVLDTEKARRKNGVLAEALALANYRRPSSGDGPVAGKPRPPKPDGPVQGGGGAKVASKRHVVEIYGAKKRCARTRQAIQLFKDAGAVVKYYDVDASPRAARVVNRNTRWLAGGELLPFIKLDGKPVKADGAGIGTALKSCSYRLQ